MGVRPERRAGASKDDILREFLDEVGRKPGRTASPAQHAPGANSASTQPRRPVDLPDAHRAPASPSPVAAPTRQPQDDADAILGGKYRLGKLMATGGLGEVYEAVHEVIGRRVAVKIIRREFSDNPELSARFLQEARAAGAVGHPGCVQVFDVGVSPDGRAYLVMERLDGEDLLALMKREAPLRVEDAATICSDALDVLASTHRAGIIHRDLKPENIFLSRGPRGDRWVKLLDFGVARLVDDKQGASRLTQPGTAVGTPYYMSPEQARGAQALDGGVDIYAMGVILYELLTGRLPFEGMSYNEVLAKVLSESFPSPRRVNPSVPGAFEEVILKATARRRQDRYADAAEFIAALQPFRVERISVTMLAEEGFTGTEPTGVPPPSGAGVRPASVPPPGRPPGAGLGQAARTTPAGGRMPTPRPPPRRTSSPRPMSVPAQPSRGRQIGVFLGGVVLSALLIVGGLLVGLSIRDKSSDGERTPAAGAPSAGASRQSGTIRVRILNAPPGTEMRVDDRAVGTEFELPRSDAEHTLELRLDGRRPFTRILRATENVDVDLLPLLPP